MYTTILVLMVIAAILLILVVLIQNPKGGGLSGEFGGATSQMFGVQRSGDLMEQLTWGFFAFILVGALTSGIFLDKSGSATDDGLNVEKAQARPATAPATTPAAPATAPANGTGTSQPAK
ncbi:MAG: preprotein translocase subunit SecG [Spirosomataceae bacterium]